jgi:hypothetical protein
MLDISSKNKVLDICNKIISDSYELSDIVFYMRSIDNVIRDITEEQELINISILINDDIDENDCNNLNTMEEIWLFYKDDVKKLCKEITNIIKKDHLGQEDK